MADYMSDSSSDFKSPKKSTTRFHGAKRETFREMWSVPEIVEIESLYYNRLVQLRVDTFREWKISRRFYDYAVSSTGVTKKGIAGYDQVFSFKLNLF